jgi:hypothetical protein
MSDTELTDTFLRMAEVLDMNRVIQENLPRLDPCWQGSPYITLL